MPTDANRLLVRTIAGLLTLVTVILVATPHYVNGRMPRDPVEPQKITIGAAAILGASVFVGFAFGFVSLVMGAVSAKKRDWVGIALSIPALAVCGAFGFYYFVLGGR
jgi:hypothetical protein